MAIPEFQSLMLPLLKIMGDGKEHSTSEVIETLAQQFGLDEIDRSDYANGIENLKIILIDGEQLAQLMIDHDVGVTEESRYIVKKVDLDYFGDE